MNTSPYNFELDFMLIDRPVDELRRKLSFLLTTQQGTLPFDREFGLDLSFLDRPAEAARSLFTAEVAAKVAQFVPEVRVKAVEWLSVDGGSVYPKVVITNA